MSFEEALRCRFVAIRGNPGRLNQQLLYIERNGYIWLIPCVVNGDELFFKTLFPSRKFTKKRRRGEAL